MKVISKLSWLFVGGLFIFSGLIKINDPVGTAIKLEEYFEVFATDFSSVFLIFKPYALYLSILLSALEIILGVALLLRWRLRQILASLLVLMVFFTFLTFYSAYFNKVTDCGCFGDAIKLTPWQSFSKDMVLLLLIFILLATRRYLPETRTAKVASVLVAITAVISFGIGIYAYNHEPFVDFRAYKVGNNIPTLMKPSAPLRYKYIMAKNGEEKEFTDYPTDSTWKFKKMVPLNPQDGPKITDFNVWNDTGDFTQEVFTGNKLIILVQDASKADQKVFTQINPLIAAAEKSSKNIKPVVITASSSQDYDVFRHETNLSAPYYFGDATVLKTMMRSNPGIMLLKNGQVVGKWHYNDTPDIQTIEQQL
ncbi:BT_3928 family protein [Adhaeribacter pallidiroseus]|uniref:Triose-phosphate isomerase n=1 Tax=Adhaeribacter pallidiroseus TaxID=2072847 RepID=A0A369QHB6_9BACT|nr:BT_3928 family protein [Adhaeribacter pallidiroseus]RDC64313.1 Triose-phosphate isomerase [Adhaeribacter pallidiroseus]